MAVISRKVIVIESTPVWLQQLPSNAKINVLTTEADEAMTPIPSTYPLA